MLTQDTQLLEKRLFGLIFTRYQSGWLKGKVCSWEARNKKGPSAVAPIMKKTTLQFVAELTV